jgi:hypothetical protein
MTALCNSESEQGEEGAEVFAKDLLCTHASDIVNTCYPHCVNAAAQQEGAEQCFGGCILRMFKHMHPDVDVSLLARSDLMKLVMTKVPPYMGTELPTMATMSPFMETLPPHMETEMPTVATLPPTMETLSPYMSTEMPTGATLPPTMETLAPYMSTELPTAGTLPPTMETLSPYMGTELPTMGTMPPNMATQIPFPTKEQVFQHINRMCTPPVQATIATGLPATMTTGLPATMATGLPATMAYTHTDMPGTMASVSSHMDRELPTMATFPP